MKKYVKRLNQIGEIAAWLAIVEVILLIASIYIAPIKSWTAYLGVMLLVTASPFLIFSQGLVPLISGRMRVNIALIYEFEASGFFVRLIGLVYMIMGILSLLLGLVCLIVWLS